MGRRKKKPQKQAKKSVKKTTSKSGNNNLYLIIFLPVWLFALYSCIQTDFYSWGMHSPAFAGAWASAISLLFALLLMIKPVNEKLYLLFKQLSDPLQQKNKALLAGIAFLIIACLAFVFAPLNTDMYGDTRTLLDAYKAKEGFSSGWLSTLLDVNLVNMESREPIVAYTIKAINYYTDFTTRQAFQLLSLFSGFVYMLLLVWAALRYEKGWLRFLVLTIGLLAGYTQVFHRHMENYPLAIAGLFGLLVSIHQSLKGRLNPFALLLIFLVVFKIHFLAILAFPAVVFSFFKKYEDKIGFFKKAQSWRSLAMIFLLPAAMVFLYLYISTGNYDELYTTPNTFKQKIFIPFFTQEAPYNHYSLLGFNHILDVLNASLYISLPFLPALVYLLIGFRKQINWNSGRIKVIALNLVFFSAFFFAMNPLLGPARDWDLYALWGVPLFVSFIELCDHLKFEKNDLRKVLALSLAFSLFPIFQRIVNTHELWVKERLVATGIHQFRTYYAGSSYVINMGQKIEEEKGIMEELKWRKAVLTTIEEFAPQKVHCTNMYHLSRELAINYKKEKQLHDAAKYFEKAFKYYPAIEMLYQLTFCYNQTQQIDRAIQTGNMIVNSKRSKDHKIFLFLVEAYMKKNNIQAARGVVQAGLEAYPHNPQLQQVASRLQAAGN